MDEMKRVDDIDPGILYQIQLLLKGHRWYDLLKASSLDSLDFRKYVEKMGNNKFTNLERSLLDYCADVLINDFIKWLEMIQLEEALLLLKEDEPLKIIEQPDRIIEIVMGKDKLTLSCKAQGFPTPKYEWFHERKKIFEGSVLEVSPIRFEDAGVYHCQVSNISRNGIKTSVVTSGAKVIVNPAKVSNHLKIIEQPFSPTTKKVYPGSHFTVTCKAPSDSPLSYQWYCNGNPLEGKVSPQLDIIFNSNDIYEKKCLECVVSNKKGSVASNSIILELDCEDKEFKAEDKFALLIGNSQYDHLSSLEQPAKDVCTLSQLLQSIGFKTFCFQNLTCNEMRRAIKMFSSFLRPGIYALFYFAGHGYQQSRRFSLLGKEVKDIAKDESICPEEILDFMQQGKPAVNVILLDACRKFSSQADSDKKIIDEEFKYGLLDNTIFGYATSSPHGAYEIEGQCSIFIQYLKSHIKKCIPIWEMLFKVMEEIKEDPASSSLQYPSLEVTLTLSRKLTDSIIGCGDRYELEMKRWKSYTAMPKEQRLSLKNLGINISIKCSPYQNVICNAMTINLYLTALPGYRSDDYIAHMKFYDVDNLYEKQISTSSDQTKPAFSISLFNLQCKELIRGKLLIYHKERKCICYEEKYCVMPPITKALDFWV